MHYIDIVVLVLLILFALRGVIRGLVKEFFITLGIVLGVFLGSIYAEAVGGLFPLGNASDGVVKLVGFTLVFAGVYAISHVLGQLFGEYRFVKDKERVSNQIHIIGGAVFGAIKLFLILSIVVVSFGATKKIGDAMEDKFGSSISYPILKSTGTTIVKLDLESSLEKAKNDAKKAIEGVVEDVAETVIKSAQEKFEENNIGR